MVVLIAALAVVPVAGAADDINRFAAQCVRGDDKLSNCLAAAKLGSPEAMQLLSFGYRYGWYGIPKDQTQATYWMQLGAMQGRDTAQRLLGMRYLCGLGIKKDTKQALHWFKKAAEFGKQAGLDLAGYYEQIGLTGEVNPRAALEYYTNGIKATAYGGDGKLISFYGLGTLFAEGDGVERDEVQAGEYFRSAFTQAIYWSTLGTVPVGYLSGEVPTIGEPSRETLKREFEEAQSKAEAGDPKAEFELGRIYYNGKGVRPDASNGFRWTERAANAGYGPAIYAIAIGYVRNPKVRDYAKAEALFRQIADVNPYGKFALAYLLTENVQGNKSDAERAEGVALMIAAANDNHQEAQTMLAMWYALGIHVEKDLSVSKRWWAKRMDCSHWQ